MRHDYRVVYTTIEDGWIMATVPELPGAVTQRATWTRHGPTFARRSSWSCKHIGKMPPKTLQGGDLGDTFRGSAGLMKRMDLIRHIEREGCHFDREGANHSIYRNPLNGRCTAIPRHREIKETTARTICQQLGVPRP